MVLVFPIGVATPMFRIAGVVVLGMLRVAVTEVELTALKLVTVIPVPASPFRPVAPFRLVPVIVTATAKLPLAGCVALSGLIEVTVAPSTEKGTELLAAPAPA